MTNFSGRARIKANLKGVILYEKNDLDNQKIDKLIKYYKDKVLLIVGLNDSQGVNTTSTFLKKDY